MEAKSHHKMVRKILNHGKKRKQKGNGRVN